MATQGAPTESNHKPPTGYLLYKKYVESFTSNRDHEDVVSIVARKLWKNLTEKHRAFWMHTAETAPPWTKHLAEHSRTQYLQHVHHDMREFPSRVQHASWINEGRDWGYVDIRTRADGTHYDRKVVSALEAESEEHVRRKNQKEMEERQAKKARFLSKVYKDYGSRNREGEPWEKVWNEMPLAEESDWQVAINDACRQPSADEQDRALAYLARRFVSGGQPVCGSRRLRNAFLWEEEQAQRVARSSNSVPVHYYPPLPSVLASGSRPPSYANPLASGSRPPSYANPLASSSMPPPHAKPSRRSGNNVPRVTPTPSTYVQIPLPHWPPPSAYVPPPLSFYQPPTSSSYIPTQSSPYWPPTFSSYIPTQSSSYWQANYAGNRVPMMRAPLPIQQPSFTPISTAFSKRDPDEREFLQKFNNELCKHVFDAYYDGGLPRHEALQKPTWDEKTKELHSVRLDLSPVPPPPLTF